MRYVPSENPAQDAGTSPVSDDCALLLSGLSKSFGAVTAVAGVSLELRRGEILCLLGPSGCGKTTTLRLIAGFDTPDAGRIRIGGRPVYGDGVNQSPEKRRVGMVFQDGALFPHLTVAKNVAFGLPKASGPRISGRKGPGRRGSGYKAAVADALQMVGLAGYDNRYPHQLSGGQQQRVALARALAPEPELILMDEPFSSLDPGLRAQLRSEVRHILRARRATVVCVTHDQEEAMHLGDRVLVMQDGRIEQIGAPEALFHNPQTRFAAQFFGSADFLPAWPNGPYLASEIGQIPWPDSAPSPWPQRRDLQIMARPDCLDIAPDDHGGGVIVQRDFLGAFYLYTVELASGRRVRALKSHVERLEPGTRVRVCVQPGHTLLPFSHGQAIANGPAPFAELTDSPH